MAQRTQLRTAAMTGSFPVGSRSASAAYSAPDLQETLDQMASAIRRVNGAPTWHNSADGQFAHAITGSHGLKLTGDIAVAGPIGFLGGLTGDNFSVADTSGNTLIGGTAGVTGLLSFSGGVSGENFSVADMSGDTVIGGTLGAGATTLSSAKVSDLTSGRVVLAGTAGEIEDSGNLTFNGSTLAITGAATVSTDLTVTGNLLVSGDTVTMNVAELQVEDKLIAINSAPGGRVTNAAAGLIISGSNAGNDIAWQAVSDGGRMELSKDSGVASGKAFFVDSNNVLSQTTLGSTVLSSSLGTVGTITTGVWSGTALIGAKIGNDQIDSQHYADGSIDTAHIAADQITNALIADAQIDSEHYVDGSVDNVHLANSTISGKALGTNLDSLTKVANGGIALSSYNGSGAVADLALDIVGMNAAAGLADADVFAAYDADASAHKKMTLLQLKSFISSGGTQKAVIDITSTLAAGSDLASGMAAWDALEAQREVFVNGQLLQSGADASANNDWYPGSAATDLRFEFDLVAGDVVQLIVR
jgi:hypothetical protein